MCNGGVKKYLFYLSSTILVYIEYDNLLLH
jgi:hypothetical protein